MARRRRRSICSSCSCRRAPGGGWDQTARTIEQVLRATGAVKGVQITNVGGAGGAVGLPQFLNQWKGRNQKGSMFLNEGSPHYAAVCALFGSDPEKHVRR